MRAGFLPDSDEFLTVDDALLLIAEFLEHRRADPALTDPIPSREQIELELRAKYEGGTIALQDEESMRVGSPSQHLDSTRQRVTAAIKSSPPAAVGKALYISFADFEDVALRFFISDVDKVLDRQHVTIYDVQNELGYTIRGAARALAKKYSVSEQAMAERIFEAAEQGKLQVKDPQTGLKYIPKNRSYCHERISVFDLNQWLQESGVPYRLGKDAAEEPAATAATRPQAINRRTVMRIFSVKPKKDENHKFWDDKLGRPPLWLVEARIVKGRRGVSSGWDPLLVARALLERGKMNLNELDSAIHKHLPALLDQWKEETGNKRK